MKFVRIALAAAALSSAAFATIEPAAAHRHIIRGIIIHRHCVAWEIFGGHRHCVRWVRHW